MNALSSCFILTLHVQARGNLEIKSLKDTFSVFFIKEKIIAS